MIKRIANWYQSISGLDKEIENQKIVCQYSFDHCSYYIYLRNHRELQSLMSKADRVANLIGCLLLGAFIVVMGLIVYQIGEL